MSGTQEKAAPPQTPGPWTDAEMRQEIGDLRAVNKELLEALEAMPCADCGHELGMHAIKPGGCQSVRTYDPCGCEGGEEDKKLITLIAKARGRQL